MNKYNKENDQELKMVKTQKKEMQRKVKKFNINKKKN